MAEARPVAALVLTVRRVVMLPEAVVHAIADLHQLLVNRRGRPSKRPEGLRDAPGTREKTPPPSLTGRVP